MDNENEVLNVLILGSGPAGLSAAIYAARAELKPVVLTGLQMGGQASLTTMVENYPGFPDGIGGAELGELLLKQAEKFGARVLYELATEIDLNTSPMTVKTENSDLKTRSLIIATGANPVLLNIPGEKELVGRGVSYCATCDGWFFKDKKVVVIGGGDSALEEGLFLTRFASEVTIIHRRDTLRASAILQKRAEENPKIKFILNTIPLEIKGTEKVESILVKDNVGNESLINTDGVFIFIGHFPNSEMLAGKVDMDPKRFIKVNSFLETSVPGVFAAGEVADPNFKQVITSAGMGAAAAIRATHYLENLIQSG